MKKILIIGANGGIGKYLVDYFCNQKKIDYELIGVGRHPSEFVEKKIKYIRADITDKDSISLLPKDIYSVILLAGAMPARMKGYTPRQYIDTNIVGVFNILEYCVVNHVDRILFSQSFGDIKEQAEKNLILKPEMRQNFKYDNDHSVYIVTKNCAVELIKCYHAIHHLKSFIFRLPTIYSWSSNDSYYVDGILRKRAWRILINKAIAGEDIEVWGNPNRLKDMVYVKDFCQMLFKACFVNNDFGYYNVGTGVGTTLLDQIKGIIEVFCLEGHKSRLIMRPDKPDAPQYIMSIDNARRELGYKPEYSYLDMLHDMKREKELNRF